MKDCTYVQRIKLRVGLVSPGERQLRGSSAEPPATERHADVTKRGQRLMPGRTSSARSSTP
jgi:hypothetical protein